MMELKAKKRIITVMKMLVQPPSCPVSACCASSMPVRPDPCQSGERSTIIAEAVQTISVSTKTPSACTSPCFTGCDASAVAAAFGTEPMPASFEKRPRFTPVMTARPKPAPMAESKLKVLETMSFSTSGTSVMFITVTMSATRR